MNSPPKLPVVTVFAGHDPTGGAGIQADAEAITASGARATTIITALTTQDTRNVFAFTCVDTALLQAQARVLLEDMAPDAFKVGMTGSVETVRALVAIFQAYPEVPLVVDPVLAAGGGTPLGDSALLTALIDELFPLVTLLTPNEPEVRALAPEATTLAECAAALIARGCRYILITGGHCTDTDVVNRLFDANGLICEFRTLRFRGEFHGSGCTLSSAIAARIACGASVPDAVSGAVEYTRVALANARTAGSGQKLPDRFFMLNRADEKYRGPTQP